MIRLVISGGQTGADQAGLRAAVRCGIATGGYAPQGWLTLNGPQPLLLQRYGLVEYDVPGYGARTDANVKMADVTLRFAANWTSPGELRTHAAIRRFGRPCFDVDYPAFTTPDTVAEWLDRTRAEVLNVAGNSDRTAPGIGVYVEEFLVKVFALVQPTVS